MFFKVSLILIFIMFISFSLYSEVSTSDNVNEVSTHPGGENIFQEFCSYGCSDDQKLNLKMEGEEDRLDHYLNLNSDYTPPSTDPIAHYTFDDTPEDAAGSYDGTIVGDVTTVNGKIGQTYKFVEPGNYVDIKWDAPIEEHSFTIGAWVNYDDLNKNLYIFYDSNGYKRFRFSVDADTLGIIWRYNNYTSNIKLEYQFLTTGKFQHVAVTYDAESKEVYMYVNGMIVAQNIDRHPSGAIDIDNPRIGNGFGIIDDVRVYDYALTSDQIKYLVVAADNEEPTNPQNLTAETVLKTQIDLSWEAASDDIEVTGYLIYRDGDLLTTVTDTQYSDTGLTAGTDYNYTVKSIDMAGKESSGSSVTGRTLAEGECLKTDRIEQVWNNLDLVTVPEGSKVHLKTAAVLTVVDTIPPGNEWKEINKDVNYKAELFEVSEEGNEGIADSEPLDTQFISTDYCYFVGLQPGRKYKVRIASTRDGSNYEEKIAESDIIRTSADAKGGLF